MVADALSITCTVLAAGPQSVVASCAGMSYSAVVDMHVQMEMYLPSVLSCGGPTLLVQSKDTVHVHMYFVIFECGAVLSM